MIIKQEEESPIEDLWDSYNLNAYFKNTESLVRDIDVNTDEVIVYINVLSRCLKDFLRGVESLAKAEEKKKMQEELKEKVEQGRFDN